MKTWCSEIIWLEPANGGYKGWRIYDKELVPDGWKLCPICGKERPKELMKLKDIFVEILHKENVFENCAVKQAKAALEAVFEVIDGYKELHGVYSMSGLKKEIREKLA